MSEERTVAVFKTATEIYMRERRYNYHLEDSKKDMKATRTAEAKSAAFEARALWDEVETSLNEADDNEDPNELEQLRLKVALLERDNEDMRNASDAIFERCKCGRMTEKKYRCMHCGADE